MMNIRYSIMSFSLVTLLVASPSHVHAFLDEETSPKRLQRSLAQTLDTGNPAKRMRIEEEKRISLPNLRKLITSNPYKIKKSDVLQKRVMDEYYNGLLAFPTRTIVNLLPNLTQDCLSNPLATFIFVRYALEKGYVIPQNLFDKINVAASQGDVHAQYNLGVMYRNGWLSSNGRKQHPNFPKSFSLFKDAATQGHTKAQLNLAILFQYGCENTDENQQRIAADKAVKWYAAAAKKGYAPAQNNLGVMFQEGWQKAGGRQYQADPDKAFECYAAAAKQGFAGAQYNLGVMFQEGWLKTGGRKQAPNPDKALKLFTAAAKQGHARAQEKVIEILVSVLKKLR